MRSRDVQDELADGFEAGPLPPMGPNGAPMLEPVRELPTDPPRLCEAGPCRHYHTMTIQLDAQQPGRERRDDGTVVDHGRVFHTEVHHYCYPDVGIETNLGALPVLSCNRWAPITSLLRGKRRIRRAYDRALEAFHRARDQEIADALPELAKVCVYVTTPEVHVAVDADPADDMLAVLARAGVEVDLATHDVVLDGDVVENLSVTIEQLGYPEQQPMASGLVEVALSIQKKEKETP